MAQKTRAAEVAEAVEYVDADNGQVKSLVLTDLVVNEDEERFIVDWTFIKYALGPSDKETFENFKERLHHTIENAHNETQLMAELEVQFYFKKFAMQHHRKIEPILAEIETERPR